MDNLFTQFVGERVPVAFRHNHVCVHHVISYIREWCTQSKDTETVINALIKQTHKLPRELYKSLTWDRGKGNG